VKYKLSICIPTLNRGSYIGETLESIVSQWEDGIEVVIVDGGSTDETEIVVGTFQKNFPQIRYVKKDLSQQNPSNEGFDRDCDYSAMLAEGEYCWLMADDDLLKRGALRKILSEIERGYSLIVANAEVMNSDFSEVLVHSRLALSEDRVFGPNEWDLFAETVGLHLTFVGAVIVKRQFWLSRNREKYYGFGFIHVGVIFDEPITDPILATVEPLVSIRFGNALWSSRAFQIWMINWPSLIWSFSSLSNTVKASICSQDPCRKLTALLFNRALGMYSMREYELFVDEQLTSRTRKACSRLIAMIPRSLLYIPAWVYIRLRVPNSTFVLFNLKESWKTK
jgi:glycosyltransferase involved in cell wall biosynthesis